jgi:hypothetical protein
MTDSTADWAGGLDSVKLALPFVASIPQVLGIVGNTRRLFALYGSNVATLVVVSGQPIAAEDTSQRGNRRNQSRPIRHSAHARLPSSLTGRIIA